MTTQVALISGASGGLGTVVTDLFLESGYRVSAVALDWPRRPVQTESLLVIKADLTLRAAAESAVKKTLKRWGSIDFLVHLVGGFAGGSRVEDTTDDEWDEMLNVNLRTAVNMMRAVIPPMRARGEGRLMVVGSTTAIDPVVTWGPFCTAVAGLCSLVRVAAAELRSEGITVNALLPTTIDTPVVRGMMGDSEAAKWVDPRSLGSMMLWLCSEAGRDVTGALIPVIGRQPHPCFDWHGETDV
jgi:NAD(P)-dependent dehydrogenase (short-subunit alcohol dehydrogenase family)